MTDSNENTPVDIEDNLDDFSNTFFGKPEPVKEEAVQEEEVVEDEEEIVEDSGEVDPPAPEEEDELEEEEPEEDPQPKKKKNSFQERINELTAKAREAERREQELLARLEAIEAGRSKEEKKPELKDILPEDAPSPDAVNEDGEPLYPLGEFDPKFIRDLTRFTIRQEKEAQEAEEAKVREQREIEAAREQLHAQWTAKLENVTETIAPDYKEKVVVLDDTFRDIEPAYGEYLITTIMSSEVGPEILYYLSNNIGEARKIVASGPSAATLALGRLEAKFIKSDEDKGNTKKVSKAPEPPLNLSRGAQGKFTVRPDTDDLDAFEREFFKK